MRDTTAGGEVREHSTFLVRLLVAVAQAAVLYWLTEAETAAAWPATDARLFIPFVLAWAFVPLIIMQGLGQIRPWPLAIWALIAAAVIAGIGYHDAVRGRFIAGAGAVVLPRYELWPVLAGALFVAHVLVLDSVIERRLMPPYGRHFDTATKLGVQAILAGGFVVVSWGVLVLGAGLFKLLDIEFFVHLLERRWFEFPVTTLALAVAIHVTDVQPSLINGLRSLALTLLSWLLPLLVLILLGFLGSLPFISLEPLWRTHFATTLLLLAAGLLVFLINSFYQDGVNGESVSRVKRIAAVAGAIELVPLVGLAAWALSLRVGQYGWSVERILAAAVVVVAACGALGYAAAALLSPASLKRVETTNVVTAYVFLALVLALFSPLADPARLMVADQVARLKSGAIPPEKFDFTALKLDGARWGFDALIGLSRTTDGTDATRISMLANRALAATGRHTSGEQLTADDMAGHILVYPEGRALPAGLLDLKSGPFTAATLPTCLRSRTAPKCVARFVTLRPGDAEAILLLDFGASYVLQPDASGQWHDSGRLSGPLSCIAVRQALQQGEFTIEPHAAPDLVIGGQRVDIDPPGAPCPNPIAIKRSP